VAATASRQGVLHGRIRSILYHGLHIEAHVELGNGTLLRVELTAHQNRHLRQGDEVDIDIFPAGTWLLQRDEE
jgi:hypothetical protein